MPVGAVIGSAVVGAGASALSASKNSKAINKATDAQSQANREAVAAQERARAENMALQRPLYDAGMPAVHTRNALLGLGGANDNAQQTPTPQPKALAQYYQGANPDSTGAPIGGFRGIGGGPFGPLNPGQAFKFNALTGDIWANDNGVGQVPTTGGTIPPTTGNGGRTAQQAADDAFGIYRDSSGYQFRLGEGMNALNSGWAGAGTLQSGAAMKAALEFGQDFASNEFGNYMGYLGDQQQLAYGAANAMSGVNTNYANSAGQLAIANGQNITNAAVAKANNSNALIGSIGNQFGNVLNTVGFGGGFGGGVPMGNGNNLTGGIINTSSGRF